MTVDEPNFSDLPITMLDAVKRAARHVDDRRSFALSGPPGTGKTMLARRLVGLLSVDDEQVAEMRGVYRALGMKGPTLPPFRAPHHTISGAALAGRFGGEAELARYGVLFLDEIVEFPRSSLESLRHYLGGMGEGRPVVVASTNPCPCGFAKSTVRECACSVAAIGKYFSRALTNMKWIGIEPEDLVEVDTTPLESLRGPRCPSTADIIEMVRGRDELGKWHASDARPQ